MAHISSGILSVNRPYTLGDYTFSLQVNTSQPTNIQVTAICRNSKVNKYASSIQTLALAPKSWCVEADENVATVYAILESTALIRAVRVVCAYDSVSNAYVGDFITGRAGDAYGNVWSCTLKRPDAGATWLTKYNGKVYAASEDHEHNLDSIYYLTSYPNEYGIRNVPRWGGGWATSAVAGAGIYARCGGLWGSIMENVPFSAIDPVGLPYNLSVDGGEYMIGRFLIDVETAGGTGEDSPWEEPEEITDYLSLELDNYSGEPGAVFVGTITGHRKEAMTVTITDSAGDVLQTLSVAAPASKDAAATVTIQTAASWLSEDQYSEGYYVTVVTDTTGRTASDSFTLYSEEFDPEDPPTDILYAYVDPDEGKPGETLSAHVGGHNGTAVSAVVTNSAGATVLTFPVITPTDEETEIVFSIPLSNAWFSTTDASREGLVITAVSADEQTASAGFSMYILPKTLYLTVTGATAGTHQSGVLPTANSKVADYGCGGDGGHGGAGGAGSSTVVIHKFVTNQANHKELTAITKSPGNGTPGGKGGKGGDGIILLYY